MQTASTALSPQHEPYWRLALSFMAALSLIATLFVTVPASAAELGDDGLHKAEWMRDTFKDLREDLEEANAEGKRLMIIIEQRGCIYCRKMHEEIFPDPVIDLTLNEDFFVIQLNMFGDIEVTDFDGEVLAEKDIVRKWGQLFTPTIMYFPEEVAEDATAQQAAVAIVPGAFEKGTTYNMMQWVLEKGYESDEPFQKYLARKLSE